LPFANFACDRGWVINTDILLTLQRPRLRRRLAVVRPRELRVPCLGMITPRHRSLQNRWVSALSLFPAAFAELAPQPTDQRDVARP